ncbi:MAG: hypothetical protein CGW95_06315 [Phenylobacterium zucineum]|nr:MAG: hypothetical protein CGW95_06315 [Phenylobacterium zucineum]
MTSEFGKVPQRDQGPIFVRPPWAVISSIWTAKGQSGRDGSNRPGLEPARACSQGGLSTKIHAASSSLRDAVRLIGRPGQGNDMRRAGDLIKGLKPDYVLADRAYDVDRFHDAILEVGAAPVIPPKRNRRGQQDYDKDFYKEHNRIDVSLFLYQDQELPPSRNAL